MVEKKKKFTEGVSDLKDLSPQKYFQIKIITTCEQLLKHGPNPLLHGLKAFGGPY